jgi:transcriptional regulator with XRE-family HTH domain
MARRFRNCIGPQVRRFRMERGWTQDGLAAKLQLAGLHGVDRVVVAKIESRLRSTYDYEAVVIARVLGVPLDRLVPGPSSLDKDLEDLIAGER